ncbi:ABC transporter permease [Allorhodopirellula heiligendammensis]|uniref:ABC transporter permease n=1 Tax=Allorhodopirellula heiligendammensis TaxID=2714739 RepID=A0A5C6BFM5_9BACT|nr:ABC transporter permease [Allorhodopirellula heiligendammensis]TWU10492.1 hypothetical protein Poly21_43960 [Allorhodopirellula heiligendammensis]
MAEPISLSRLAIALVPVVGLLIWLAIEGHSLRGTLQGLARMLIQLSLVGYVLVFLFESDRIWVTLVSLTAMMMAASAIAIRTAEQKPWGRYLQVIVSIMLGGGVTLAVITVGVLNVQPWYNPRILIPLAGMTFSNCMNALSLAIERLDSSTDGSPDSAVRVALIPITNSLFAVGVVSIPGMMTGQVLAGVSPLIAARYQIMIMCLIFASAGLSLLVFMRLQPKAKAA